MRPALRRGDPSATRIALIARLHQLRRDCSHARSLHAIPRADYEAPGRTHTRKEWYVSISRARRKIAVFTPDVAALAAHIAASGDRMLGLELIPEAAAYAQAATAALRHEAIARTRQPLVSP